MWLCQIKGWLSFNVGKRLICERLLSNFSDAFQVALLKLPYLSGLSLVGRAFGNWFCLNSQNRAVIGTVGRTGGKSLEFMATKEK